jgi:hypothetical protein
VSGFFKRLFGSEVSSPVEQQLLKTTLEFEARGRKIADDCFENGLVKGEIVRLAEIEKTIAENLPYRPAAAVHGFLQRMIELENAGEVIHAKEQSGDTVFIHKRHAKEILSGRDRPDPKEPVPPAPRRTATTPVGKAYELYVQSEAEALAKKFHGTLITKTPDGKLHLKFNGAGNILEDVRALAMNANEILVPGCTALCRTEGGKLMIDHCVITAFDSGADEKVRRPSEQDLVLLMTYAVSLVSKNLCDTDDEIRSKR